MNSNPCVNLVALNHNRDKRSTSKPTIASKHKQTNPNTNDHQEKKYTIKCNLRIDVRISVDSLKIIILLQWALYE
jgi:hypothetical protein